MSVKILLDMNLSPDWVAVLDQHVWSTVHWSDVGDIRATDRTIMDWAVENEYIVADKRSVSVEQIALAILDQAVPAIEADTERTWSNAQLAAYLDNVTANSQTADVPFDFDPDDYPLS